MVKEAGGTVTDFDGAPANVFTKETLATNGLIHDQMLAVVKNNDKHK